MMSSAIMEQESLQDIYELGRHLGHSSVKVINLYLAWVARQSGTENAPNRQHEIGGRDGIRTHDRCFHL